MSPDCLPGLARTAAAAAPDPAALTAALTAGSAALMGLASGEALAEVGLVWARQVEVLHARWRMLARDVERARVDYADVDADLAS